MPVAVSFTAGFVLAQLAWWLVARNAVGPVDEAAFGGVNTFRYLVVASLEILVAAVAFGGAMGFSSRWTFAGSVPKACMIAAAAGAITSTVTAGPYALIPRLLQGEAQLLVYVAAAGIASAAFGVLVGMAFRERGAAA